MLHGICGELPGGARLGGGPSHALYKPGAALVGPSAGQGCAQEDDDDEEDAWCWGPDLELPWTAGWGPQLNGLPASWPWGETEVPQKGHLGREADTLVLPLKPEFGVQAWWQAEPEKAVWGPCWSWEAGPGSSIPMRAGVEALYLSPQPSWSFPRSCRSAG